MRRGRSQPNSHLPRTALAAAGCMVAALCCSQARPCAAQSTKLADRRPEYGGDAAIEADLLRGSPARPAARPAASRQDASRKPLRVLLVGNSYTNFNLLHMLIERIGESAGGPRLHVEAEARPGFSL